MARYTDVLNVFKTNFNDLSGKFSAVELNDRLYIEIQNNKHVLNNILTCKPRSVRGVVWVTLLNLVDSVLEWYELPTGASSTQVKQALSVVYGANIYDAIQPTIDYYIKRRATGV